MRELTISEMEIVSGAVTEAQCATGFMAVGWVVGAVLTRTGTGAANVATLGSIVGGLVCGSLTGDGDA